jgi:hypothetical protein
MAVTCEPSVGVTGNPNDARIDPGEGVPENG